MKRRRASSRAAARGGGEVEQENVDIGAGYMEENVLAMVDSQGVKDAASIQDDKLLFLEIVYDQFVLSEQAKPSKRVYNAVYSCLRDSTSVEVAMASYRVLTDLDKVASEVPYDAATFANSMDFSSLAKDLIDEDPSSVLFVPKVLVFEHFVDQVAADFNNKRSFFCGDNVDDFFVEQQLESCSSLNLFFDKVLMPLLEFSSDGVDQNGVKCLLYERIHNSVKLFITLIFELDELKASSPTSRNYIDTFLGRLLLKINEDNVLLFVRALQRPDQKLQFIMKFLGQKFTSKRKAIDFSSFENLLQNFDDRTAQILMKEDNSQLLLVEAFQAFLLLNPSDDSSSIAAHFVATFERFQSASEDFALDPAANQALIVAELLSKNR